MNKDEIKLIVKDAILEAFADPIVHCRYGISPEEHATQHEALKNFMTFTNNVNGIKWKTIQTIVIIIVGGLFSLMLFGAYIKLKLTTFFLG